MLIVICKLYNVSLKCCESTRHIDRCNKNNKLLHWYVSITGLSKKSQQLQGCQSVVEDGKRVCPEQLMQPPAGASSCTSMGALLQVAPPSMSSGERSQCLSVPQPQHTGESESLVENCSRGKRDNSSLESLLG